MRRRTVLGSVGSLFLAGCNGLRPSAASSTRPDATTARSVAAERTTTADKPMTSHQTTTTASPELGVETEYAFAERHAWNHWELTVTALDLTTTLRHGYHEETYELPDDEQLAVATVNVTNDGSHNRSWFAGRFAFVLGDQRVVEPVFDIEYPEDDTPIVVLPRVEHARQYETAGLPVGYEETEQLWLVSTFPRTVRRDEVGIGFDSSEFDEKRYEIRWVPE